MLNDKPKLNSHEVGNLLGLSPNTVVHNAKNNRLKGAKTGGVWQFFAPYIQALIEQKRSKENLLRPSDVANTLKQSIRTVKNWTDWGYIQGTRQGVQIYYEKTEVEKVAKRISARRALDDLIKELYCCYACGVETKELAEYSGKEQRIVSAALDQYNLERQRYLKNLGLPNQDVFEHRALLTYTEVAARLKVVDWRVVVDLAGMDKLKFKEFHTKRGKKRFIIKDSLVEFLGSHAQSVLYKSDHVAEMAGKTLYAIDKKSARKNIGFKLKETKQGIRLYSKSDMQQLTGKYS